MAISVLVVRGATGTILWDRVPISLHQANWVCQRDQFTLASPSTATEANAFLTSLAQHSQPLVGNIAQVVQLDL